MMLHVICGYPSKSQGTYNDFNRADFDAYKFVRAVKGKSFNGFAIVRHNGKDHRLENDATGRQTAMDLAGRVLAGKLYNELGLREAAVVPVPASDHIVHGTPFTGSRLAQSIAAAFPAFRAFPEIRFTQTMAKAADGGNRAPGQLLPYMHLEHPLPDLPIILLDDVASTHGHLKAAARLLRQAGHPATAAVCVAQTVWERPPKMFDIPPHELAIDRWPGDNPGLFD